LLSSKTIFIILFIGVITSVLSETGVGVYMLAKGIAFEQPIAWYYYVGIIVAFLYIGIVGIIMVEQDRVMKIALTLLLFSAVLVVLNVWWFISSPTLLISGTIFGGILSGAAWYIFREAIRKTI
jgi:hypothetical protein